MASGQDANAEGLILCGLGNHLLARRNGVVTRIGRNDLFNEGEAADVDDVTWEAAIDRLTGSGSILTYKITDLPGTLPLGYAYQTGYTTREHLLGLLKEASAAQAEELRAFLAEAGIEVPAPPVRVPVTAAHTQRIDNAVRKLNGVRAEIADRNPGKQVAWYLDTVGSLCLMVEPEDQMEPDHGYIAHKAKLRASGRSPGTWWSRSTFAMRDCFSGWKARRGSRSGEVCG